MSKRKPNIKWIDRALTFSPLYIGICFNEKAFRREAKRILSKKTAIPKWVEGGWKNGTTHFMKAKNGAETAIVCIKVRKRSTEAGIIGLIVHEAMHIWQKTIISLGEEYPGAEFEAYSVQNISQQLIAEYLKTRSKNE